MREPDVLDLAAREHRELHRALRRLLAADGPEDLATGVDVLASSVARHEAMDRLLLYPLVGRDAYGRRSLVDRRAEQRSISDQLAKAVRTADEIGQARLLHVLDVMRVTFIGHSDREEIEDFPHARRLSSSDERLELAALRQQLREALGEHLPRVPTSAARRDGRPERLGPVQIAIAKAKEILHDLDRSAIAVG